MSGAEDFLKELTETPCIDHLKGPEPKRALELGSSVLLQLIIVGDDSHLDFGRRMSTLEIASVWGGDANFPG
jgi:hypothetical protein